MIAKFWEPPPYDKVDDFIGGLRRENVHVALGTLEDEQLQCRMMGRVDVVDLLPFNRRRDITGRNGFWEKRYRRSGFSINGQGVAVLLDKTGERLAL